MVFWKLKRVIYDTSYIDLQNSFLFFTVLMKIVFRTLNLLYPSFIYKAERTKYTQEKK